MNTTLPQRVPILERLAALLSSAPFIALAAVAIVLNAPLSGSLWLDESVSAWIIRDGLSPLLLRVDEYQGQSPFYFLLLWGWSGIFGSSEVALRGLSMLAAGGTAYAVFATARELRDRETGMWSVLFLLASDGFVKSAFSARPYAVALCFLTFSVLMLCRWLRSGQRAHLIGATLCTLGAFYCQYFFGEIVLVQLALVGLHPQVATRLKAFFVSLVVLFVASLPGLAHLWEIATRQSLYSFSGLPHVQDLARALFPPGLFVYVITAALLTRVYYRFVCSDVDRKKLLVAALWWTLPVLTFFLASWVLGSSLFFWRFYLWSSIGLALLLALLLRALDLMMARRLIAAVIVVLLLIVPRRWLVEDWRQAAAIVNRQVASAAELPVLVYSGFIELEAQSWLEDPRRRSYLLAPFESYPIDARPLLISSDIGAGEGRRHFEDRVLPVLAQHERALLISPHMQQLSGRGGVVPEHFQEEFERRGFEVTYLQRTGLVWVLSISRSAAANEPADAAR